MQLKEVMTTDVQIVSPDATLADAGMTMRDGEFGMLPVGENDRLIGTVTDRDITVRGVAERKDPGRTTVREVMSPDIVYCFEDQSDEDAARLMSEHQIRRLPILNRNKRLVGIVALGDFAVEASSIRPAAKALSDVSAP